MKAPRILFQMIEEYQQSVMQSPDPAITVPPLVDSINYTTKIIEQWESIAEKADDPLWNLIYSGRVEDIMSRVLNPLPEDRSFVQSFDTQKTHLKPLSRLSLDIKALIYASDRLPTQNRLTSEEYGAVKRFASELFPNADYWPKWIDFAAP